MTSSTSTGRAARAQTDRDQAALKKQRLERKTVDAGTFSVSEPEVTVLSADAQMRLADQLAGVCLDRIQKLIGPGHITLGRLQQEAVRGLRRHPPLHTLSRQDVITMGQTWGERLARELSGKSAENMLRDHLAMMNRRNAQGRKDGYVTLKDLLGPVSMLLNAYLEEHRSR